MIATLTPESYKAGRHLVKYFTLSQSIQLKEVPFPFSKISLLYSLDNGTCQVMPSSEDDSINIATEYVSSRIISVDPNDYSMVTLKADKYVLEEYFDRTRNIKVVANHDFDFEDL